MATTLGNLLYQIKTNNAQFKSDMKDNRGEIKELDKTAEQSRKNMRKWGAAITAVSAGVIVAFTKMANTAGEYAEQLDMINKQTGITVEEASRLGYAARQELGSIEQLTTGLTRLSRNALDASEGVGEARRAFDRLDISVVNADGSLRGADELIYEIADKISVLGTETEKTGLVMQLLGRSGADLLPFLDLGRQGIEELGDEAERLGKVMSKQNVDDFRKYRDTVDAITAGFEGLKMKIANDVLPVLQALIDRAKSLVEWFNALPEPVRKTVVQLGLFSALIGLIVGPLGLIVSYLPQIVTGLNMMAGAFAPFLPGALIVVGLASIVGTIFAIREETKLLTADVEKLTEKELENRKATLEARKARLEELIERGGETRSILGEDMSSDLAKRRLEAVNENLAETNAQLDKIRKKREELIEPTIPEIEVPEIAEELTPDERFAQERQRWQALVTLGERSASEYKKWLEEQFELRIYTPETRAQIKKELEQFESDTQETLNRIRQAATEALILEPDEETVKGLAAMNFWDIDIAEQAYKELAQFQLIKRETLRGVEDDTLLYATLKDKLDLQLSQIFEKYDQMQSDREDANEKLLKERELRKQQFLLEQREISYRDYLEYLNKQLEGEDEYTDRWYELMRERQNTLNTIVQKDMQDLIDTSNEMYDNENDRITWLITQLEALKGQYFDNKVILTLINDEIEKLKSNITEPEGEAESLNWLTDILVDAGYEIEEANQKFGEWKDNMVDGLTEAIVKGEGFLDVLNNIANQIANMIMQRGLVEPFVDWIFSGVGLSGSAHTGAVVTTAGLVQDLPSYHTGGLNSSEQIIKVIPGERILSPSQNKAFEAGLMRPEVNVEVVNNTGTPVQTRKEVKFDGTRTVVRLFMEGYTKNIEGIQDILRR